MIDTRAVGQELQDLQHQIVGRIRKGQESVAGTIKTMAHAAQTIRPQIPSLPRTALTDRLPSAEAVTARLPKPEDLAARLPKPEDLAARLPKPQMLVAGAFGLAEQLIAAQIKLAGQVRHAAMPLARQGAAMLGQSIPQPARSRARTSRRAAPGKPATESSGATTSTTAKAASAKPGTTAGANGTAAKGPRSAKK